VTGLSRGPLHRCTRPVLRCAAPRVPSSAVPVSFCGPHLCRSTEVAPVRSPLSKKNKYSKASRKKTKRAKKRDREEGRSVRQLLLAPVSGSQRAFFLLCLYFSSLFLYPHL
jgi:hypothetical protein